MTKEELKVIFNQKKQRIEKTKKGLLTEKIIPGFNLTTFKKFYDDWFSIRTFEKGCYYCGTTNKTTYKLYKIQREGIRNDATRGGKRGKRLELDRIDPNLPYDDLNNLVWCCYWCNNAKSNFFTEDEFMSIGLEIGKAINKIANKY